MTARRSISDTTRSDGTALRFTFAVLIALLIAGVSSGLCQSVTANQVHGDRMEALLDSTATETYNYNFSGALKLAEDMIRLYPDRPEGYIYKCGIYSKMLMEEAFQSPDSIWKIYKPLVEKGCELSKQRVKTNPEDIKDLFNYASALVYRSRYDAAKSDWIGLMSDAVKSKKMLEKALEVDPTFYDAYSGIGAFDYYAAHLPWYLKPVAFLLGIKGDEAGGIADLKKASRLGNHSKAEAASFLAEIVYTDEKKFDEIAALASDLHRKYPGNLDYTRTLCFAYYKLHEYGKVIECADQAVNHDTIGEPDRFLSMAYIRFYRGESFAAMKSHYDAAIADYSKAIEIGEPSVLVTQAYYGRGTVYEKMGEWKMARADYQTVLKLNGDDRACRLAKVALDSLKSR